MELAIADMRSARAWTDLAYWIRSLAAVATMFPDELANKNTRKGKSRLTILMAAATFVRIRVLHEKRTDADDPVRARVSLDEIRYLWKRGSTC